MRILVATNIGGLDDNISPVFSRCQTFTIIETDGKEIKDIKIIPNQFMNTVHGAGIQVGQLITSQGINVAIAGNFGPNVASILSQAGIEMITAQGKVRDVVEKYLSGEIRQQMGAPMAPMAPPPYQPYQPSHLLQSDINECLKMLEEQIAKLEDMVNEIKKEIEKLKGE